MAALIGFDLHSDDWKRRPEGSEADVVNHIRSRSELSQLIRSLIAPVDLRAVSAVKDGSVKGEWLRFNGEPRQTIYYLHGGAYVACSPRLTAHSLRRCRERRTQAFSRSITVSRPNIAFPPRSKTPSRVIDGCSIRALIRRRSSSAAIRRAED